MKKTSARSSRRGELTGAAAAGEPALAWLASILVADHFAFAVDQAEAGGRVLSHHAALPPFGRPRFLVPLTAENTGTAASVAAFNRLRPWRVRAERAAVAAGIRIGLSWLLLRKRIVVAGLGGPDELDGRWLVDHLREVLEEPEMVFAAGLRAADTFAKPVLQLFRPDGTPLGYAKVGWNEVTIPMVRTEADLLARWPFDRSSPLAVPKLLHAGEWAGRYVSVTAPMPPGVRRLRRGDISPVTAASYVYGAEPLASARLADSGYWDRLVKEYERLSIRGIRGARISEPLLDRVRGRYGDLVMRFGRWHGDWTDWNLATAGGRLWAWDWEYTARRVPVGFDAIHHVFQREFVGRERPVQQALSEAASVAAARLRSCGISGDALTATLMLHRLELLLRHSKAEGLGAPSDPRLDLDALGTLT